MYSVKLVANPTKADPSKSYVALVLDMGYRQAFLSFSRSDIAEFLDISVGQLNSLKLPLDVGRVGLK